MHAYIHIHVHTFIHHIHMKGKILELWEAVQHPQIFRPICFIFLLNATPATGATWFFFYTNTLHFSSAFMGTINVVGAVCSLAGVVFFGHDVHNGPRLCACACARARVHEHMRAHTHTETHLCVSLRQVPCQHALSAHSYLVDYHLNRLVIDDLCMNACGVCVCVCVCGVCECMCMCLRICVCVYVYICECMCVDMHTSVYTHIWYQS